MDMSKKEIANQAILSLIRTANSLINVGDRFFKPYNVTATQYNILVILRDAEKKLSQHDLSSQLVVSRSNITGIVDRLEKLSYVRRQAHSDDRRIKLLNITKKGLDLIKRVERKYFQRLGQIVCNLSLPDLKQLQMLISKLEDAL